MSETKSVVSVSEMARMVGLSRSRFYQLQGSAFPEPRSDPDTGRPFYDDEQQQICIEVRRRNCGIDGKPILFYARRSTEAVRSRRRKGKPTVSAKPGNQILQGVRSLGLTSATASQIAQETRSLFPEGISQLDQAEVVRAVFVALMRRYSADNVGR